MNSLNHKEKRYIRVSRRLPFFVNVLDFPCFSCDQSAYREYPSSLRHVAFVDHPFGSGCGQSGFRHKTVFAVQIPRNKAESPSRVALPTGHLKCPCRTVHWTIPLRDYYDGVCGLVTLPTFIQVGYCAESIGWGRNPQLST